MGSLRKGGGRVNVKRAVSVIVLLILLSTVLVVGMSYPVFSSAKLTPEVLQIVSWS